MFTCNDQKTRDHSLRYIISKYYVSKEEKENCKIMLEITQKKIYNV